LGNPLLFGIDVVLGTWVFDPVDGLDTDPAVSPTAALAERLGPDTSWCATGGSRMNQPRSTRSAAGQRSSGDRTASAQAATSARWPNGAMLGLGLHLTGGGTIVSSNAEVDQLAEDRIRFAPGLGRDTRVWLRTNRRVIATYTRVDAEQTVITGPAGAAVDIAFS
jgi:hypothetical protein